MLAVTEFDTPMGPMSAAATPRGLAALSFASLDEARPHLEALAQRQGVRATMTSHPHLDQACQELEAYFAGSRAGFRVPTDAPGSPWQCVVWEALCEIPFGSTISYGGLARMLGRPNAARAVGLANARNPLPIVIPCHRVIASDGSMHGYAGGVDRKARLLSHEGARTKSRAAESPGLFVL